MMPYNLSRKRAIIHSQNTSVGEHKTSSPLNYKKNLDSTASKPYNRPFVRTFQKILFKFLDFFQGGVFYLTLPYFDSWRFHLISIRCTCHRRAVFSQTVWKHPAKYCRRVQSQLNSLYLKTYDSLSRKMSYSQTNYYRRTSFSC